MDQPFRIPKINVPILCHTLRGEKIAGEIFLDIVLNEGYSPEQVVDFFNEDVAFFPIRTESNLRPLLIRKESVVRIEAPELNRKFIDHISTFALRKDAILHLEASGTVHCTFVLEMPEEYSRVLDFINSRNRFVPALIDGNFTIVNSHHIYKIEE